MPGKNLTREEAAARSALLSVTSYDVTLDLTDPSDTFTSTARVVFECREPGAATFIDLIAPAVTRVVLNGRELDPDVVFADSRIQLPDLAAHNELLVVAAAAWSHTGEGLHRFTDPVDGRSYCYTQFEVADARRVFANFEQPDLKSHFTFHVAAPAGWTVWSNQPVASRAPDGDHVVWRFEETPAMSTYLTAFVAGPYVTWEDGYRSLDGRLIPLSVLVRASMAEFMDADEVFDITKRGFRFYETAFGVVYPYAKYDQAFVPEYNAGAMENIGLVTITETHVFRSRPTRATVDRRAITILHEQAHMWFGDLVTMRWWDDLWLNESFAEFVSHLAAAATRWPDAWTTFLASEKGWALNQDQLPSTHPIVADIRDLADVEVNFDGITYAKGASVLRQLVAWVGQDNFLAGVGAYLKKHAWGNATLADLLAELEVASGRDLKDWSGQWLQAAGVTTLAAAVDVAEGPVPLADAAGDSAPRTDDTARIATLTVTQSVPPIYDGTPVTPSLRPHRLGVAGYGPGEEAGTPAAAPTPGTPGVAGHGQDQAAGTPGLALLWRVEADVVGPATEVGHAAGLPVPDLLLVNDGDLAYAKLRLDARSLDTAVAGLAGLADPLARALVWASLWDATRDGEFPASRYVEAVLNSVAAETSSTTVTTLLAQLRTALAFYTAPARRLERTAAAASRLRTLAEVAEPGSDSQLQFFKSFTALAREPRDLDLLGEILVDSSAVPGLVVDTDLRWETLTALVANGRAAEGQIDAELERDPTTRGLELAAAARAAIPTPQAKMAAWIAALTDETITNATQRAIIRGFTFAPDRTLLTGFAGPYFAEIDQVWATRSREIATNVVTGLFPTLSLNDVDVVAKADAWLRRPEGSPPALQRLVTESRASVVRALRAQAADVA